MTTSLLYTNHQRKANGVFYTPDFLAAYLARKIKHYSSADQISSVLDPACGDSQLLRALAAEVTHQPLFVGIDKDVNAIAASESMFGNQNTRFFATDGLFPTTKTDSFESWCELRSEVGCADGFDVVLSNPPWGADLSQYPPRLLSHNFVLSKGQFDSYNLFIEVVLRNLAPNGLFGLILPDSLFAQEQVRLRGLLTNNTTLHLIARLGEKIFPEINRACVVVIGRKAPAPPTHQVACFRLTPAQKKDIIGNRLTLDQAELNLLHHVPQSRFSANVNYIFDIDLTVDNQQTFNKIQEASVPLQRVVFNTRGAEISKKGLACQCSNCDQWFPYPKSIQPRCPHCQTWLDLQNTVSERIVLNHNGTGNLKLKVGEDLYRYTSVSKRWINTLKPGINYKKLSIYEGSKILVRKTGVGITASLDYDNSLTNQVVYILKLKPIFRNSITLESVLAVLNSRAMTYFLLKKFGENEWKSHPYLTQTMLVELPFPKAILLHNGEVSLINQITTLIQTEVIDSKEQNIDKEADILIERMVAHYFGLNKQDYMAIFDTLHAAEPLVPIRRLLNLTVNDIFPE
ncbi:N-6 DNA methylase [Fibrella sp. ES10-3-2-2]|nr:hypothetical protein A6C57_24310 [Fibrella sp. ES10-3-2-2]